MIKAKLLTNTYIAISLGLTLGLAISSANASTIELKANPHESILVPLVTYDINKITFINDRILKATLKHGNFEIKNDPENGAILLSTKLPPSEKETLSLMLTTEKGFTQELRIKVEEGYEGYNIILQKPPEKPSLERVPNIKELTIQALKDVMQNKVENFVLQRLSKEEIKTQDLSFKVDSITTFTNKKFIIYKYECKYKIKPKWLQFHNSLAVATADQNIFVVYKI